MCTATCNYAMALQRHAGFLALPIEQKEFVLKYRLVMRCKSLGWRAVSVWCHDRMSPEALAIAERQP